MKRSGIRLLFASLCLFGLMTELVILTLPPPQAQAQTSLPTSKIGEGVYYVYATREGLVGGTTSSGYVIVPNDFFVALPACTDTSCPAGWGAVHQSCGSRCYVKVINPVTNKCRVEPIKDIGPWFTVDDWWSPSSVRYLNNRPSIPQQLPQGYTGADAARDGLNVGYGISSTGIGLDNTGTFTGRPRAVGNRAAIDLADGTWANLQLTAPDGIGSRVFVHLLWQTGESPSTVASACGHPLNQKGGTGYPLPVPSTTPNPYPPPTTVVAVTPVPATSTAIVVGTGGAGLRCRTAPSTGADIITVLAEGTKVTVRGLAVSDWLPIRCNNQDGWASTAYLSITWVTPTPTTTATTTPTPTMTATVSPTPTATGTPTLTAEPTGTATVTPLPSGTPDSTATVSPTSTITSTPTSTVQPNATTPPTQTIQPTATKTPTVAPTTAPTVTGVVQGTGGVGLRCRTAPSTGAGIISTLPEGTRVTVRGAPTSGWYPVICANRDGWVSGTYLRVSQTFPTPTPTATSTPKPTTTVTPATPTVTPVAQTLMVTGSGGANVRCRTQASLTSTIITSLPEGSIVAARGPRAGDWWPVTCADRAGYMWAAYLTPTTTSTLRLAPDVATLPPGQPTTTPTETSSAPGASTPTAVPPELPSPIATDPPVTAEPPATVPEIPVTGTGYITNPTGESINCRAAPGTSAIVIGMLAHGQEVALRGAPANGWQGVVCDGQYGYVASQFVTDTPPVPPPTEPGPDVNQAVSEPEQQAPPVESAPQGSNPGFSGLPVPVSDTWSDTGGASAWSAVDGDSGSNWYADAYGGQAIITFVLGMQYQLTGVRWMFAQAGGADTMRVQVSQDGANWTGLSTSSNRAPYTWEGAYTSEVARYVRLVFENPNGEAAVGYLGEVQIWASAPAVDGEGSLSAVSAPVADRNRLS